MTSLIRSTSTSTYANLDVSSSSFVSMATPLTSSSVSSHRLCLSDCEDSSTDICNAVGSSIHSYSSRGHKSDLHLRLPSSISDDDMSANSPDSGFESTTPSGSTGPGDFDETSKSDTFEELMKSSSLFFDPGSLKASPLCLKPPKAKTPPIRKRRQVLCRWENCGCSYENSRDLHKHLTSAHVDIIKDRFCCCWSGCKVYDRPSRGIGWLRQHVTIHTGDKRFKCIVGGCEASFASQEGYQRHVSSHFNDVNLPKAKPNSHNERKYLVKRRKIKDKMKALANTHDCMDERAINVIRNSLVEFTCPVGTSSQSCTQNHREKGNSYQVSKKGTWLKCLAYRHTLNQNHKDPARLLFFGTPRKRCRKHKVCD